MQLLVMNFINKTLTTTTVYKIFESIFIRKPQKVSNSLKTETWTYKTQSSKLMKGKKDSSKSKLKQYKEIKQ